MHHDSRRAPRGASHASADLNPLDRLRLPRADLAATSARCLAEQHRAALPDLSDVTVVLPSLAPAGAFARALVSAASGRALLLPRITTLRELADRQPVTGPRVADARRELLLYGVLREQGLVARGALWAAARELRQLSDELSLHRIGLPASLEEFARRIARAYGAADNASMRFEARIAFETWHRLAGDGDSASRYQIGLAAAADAAGGPLWLIDPGPLNASEAAFLDRWCARSPVTVVEGDVALDAAPFARMLAAALPGDHAAPLAVRARRFADDVGTDPAVDRLSLYGALHLEDEAAAADLRIRQWLADGAERIAIVALDRLAARRLRALLERAGILVQDETGWTLSTVAAATVVARWLDCVVDGFPALGLLDLLKSPYVFSDRPASFRRDAVARMERWIREDNIGTGLDRVAVRAAADAGGADVLAVVDRLTVSRRPLEASRAPAHGWLARLRESLDLLGVSAGLAADPAGAQVLDCLSRLEADTRADALPLAFGEWRRWLDAELETALFRDRDIRSPVVMSHPGGLRMRRFDGVVLLGADIERLPQRAAPGLFFNDAVRHELELPTAALAVARQREDLLALMLDSDRVFVTWLARRDGADAPPGPWLDAIETFHGIAWGTSLRDATLRAQIVAAAVPAPSAAPLPEPPTMPAPSAPGLLPERVSVSAWGSFVACPYRFHARHQLGLARLDDLTDTLDKRNLGELVHRVLYLFHKRHPVASDEPREALSAALHAITSEVFDPVAAFDALAPAWAARWRKRIESYLDFHLAREAAGWRWSEGEVKRERVLGLADGSTVIFHGRLDRIDVRGDDELDVLDYKTVPKARLLEGVGGNDVQLPSYAFLVDGASAAGFVTVDEAKVEAIPLQGDVRDAADAEGRRLIDSLSRARAGAPMPAHGDESTCTHCEMRGLCRRDHWT
jgi:ATP-dependent helicase/nuclease subunit B